MRLVHWDIRIPSNTVLCLFVMFIRWYVPTALYRGRNSYKSAHLCSRVWNKICNSHFMFTWGKPVISVLVIERRGLLINILTCRKVLSSNLGRENSCPEFWLLLITSFHPDKCWERALKYATTAFPLSLIFSENCEDNYSKGTCLINYSKWTCLFPFETATFL
jgi:hypothetical protein